MKDQLIFLDTESTGNEPSKDHLVQVCYKLGNDFHNEYFKPPVPMSVKAMSVTHITNKFLADKPAFEGSSMQAELQKLLQDNILVAHNALFDIAILKNGGVEVPRFIDTLRLARHLDPECKIPEYNLQFLRYFLDLDVEAVAHDALGDVKVLEALFKRLSAKMPSVEEMLEVSSRPTLFKYMLFGKYKGRPIEEILETDRRYLEWLLSQKENGDGPDEDWIYTLKHYLEFGT